METRPSRDTLKRQKQSPTFNYYSTQNPDFGAKREQYKLTKTTSFFVLNDKAVSKDASLRKRGSAPVFAFGSSYAVKEWTHFDTQALKQEAEFNKMVYGIGDFVVKEEKAYLLMKQVPLNVDHTIIKDLPSFLVFGQLSGKAVQKVHDQDIVHLDLRLNNFRLSKNGGSLFVCGFDNAQKKTTEVYQADIPESSWHVAPESRGYGVLKVNFPQDIYSLGMLYQRLMKAQQIKEVPESITSLCLKMTLKNPDERPLLTEVIGTFSKELQKIVETSESKNEEQQPKIDAVDPKNEEEFPESSSSMLEKKSFIQTCKEEYKAFPTWKKSMFWGGVFLSVAAAITITVLTGGAALGLAGAGAGIALAVSSCTGGVGIGVSAATAISTRSFKDYYQDASLKKKVAIGIVVGVFVLAIGFLTGGLAFAGLAGIGIGCALATIATSSVVASTTVSGSIVIAAPITTATAMTIRCCTTSRMRKRIDHGLPDKEQPSFSSSNKIDGAEQEAEKIISNRTSTTRHNNLPRGRRLMR